MSIIAVVGLGYVGLPLAVEFGKMRPTYGYDSNRRKIESYQRGVDPAGEVSAADLRNATQLTLTGDPTVLAQADFVIVAVPTPVDAAHQPDFAPMVEASQTVGQQLKQGAVVVYESTVYPGATEEVCIPVLERASGMKWRRDFHVGYSPERINPGDMEHTLPNIVKVVA
ncbi:MAG: Vi polysaccharide biosynthesis UDP-N-acetylglucosamine C-6 dehydrogenase TviB, partial [Acidiferrobacterales bacterium]